MTKALFKSVLTRLLTVLIILNMLPLYNASASSTNELPWPLSTSYPITTGYYYSNGDPHYGVDMAAPSGTPLYANFSGTAQFYQVYTTISGTKYLTSYGNAVYLTSTDGKYFAIYGHLSSFNGVGLTIPSSQTRSQKGNSGKLLVGTRNVSVGEVLGYVGTTGNSRGNHLHYGLKINGSWVNPAERLDPNVCATSGGGTTPVTPDPGTQDGHSPVGVVDEINVTDGNSIYIRGWAFDPDDQNHSVLMEAYIDTTRENATAGSGYQFWCSTDRPDVKSVYGLTGTGSYGF